MSNQIRDNLLRFTPFREKLIVLEVVQPDESIQETKILLRQPSVAQRDRILTEAQDTSTGKLAAGGLSRGQALAVVLCALDPDTKQPLFQEADIETLTQLPAGSWFDRLAREAMGLMEVAQKAATKSPEG